LFLFAVEASTKSLPIRFIYFTCQNIGSILWWIESLSQLGTMKNVSVLLITLWENAHVVSCRWWPALWSCGCWSICRCLAERWGI